tara:strand:+ start:133 stop:474 length:342 start_codon:yes stop_codon:yes gene_type:complete
MQSENSTILSEAESLQIVQFEGCGHVGFLFNNILLSFNKNEFFDFVEVYRQIDFARYSILFPDNKKRIVIKTLVKETQFCFTLAEFDVIKQGLIEASIILRAKELITVDKSGL